MMHWLGKLLFLLCTATNTANALKILLFIPGLAKSQYLFNNRLGCLLQAYGHDVTLVNSILFNYIGLNKPPCNITQIEFPNRLATTESDNAFQVLMQELAFEGGSNEKLAEAYERFSQIGVNACRIIADDDAIMTRFKDAKYDLVLAQALTYCNMGIANEIGVPMIWVSGGNYIFDFMSETLALPYPSSYVPSTVSIFSDKMGFYERYQNIKMNLATAVSVWWPDIGPEIGFGDIEAFKLTPRSKIPLLPDFSKDLPLTLLNGEIIGEFPRPLFSGTYFMSEFQMKSKDATKTEPLPADWQKLIDKSKKGFIIMSFGTMVNTDYMEQKMRDAFLGAFRNFPDYTIIWKLNNVFPMPDDIKNVHMVTWIPQRQLLAHPKIRLFITHGGYNSLLETTLAGVPTITIPLFFDQYGNARRASRLGTTITVEKYILSVKTMTDAMKQILQTDKYKRRAEQLSRMLEDVPYPRDKAVVHQIERAHRHFKYLPRLLAAQKLYIFQYYCLDVIGISISLMVIALAVTAKACCCIRCLIRKVMTAMAG